MYNYKSMLNNLQYLGFFDIETSYILSIIESKGFSKRLSLVISLDFIAFVLLTAMLIGSNIV